MDALGVLARHDVAERPPSLEVCDKLVPALEVLAGMEQLASGTPGWPQEFSRHERVAFGDEGEAQPRIDLQIQSELASATSLNRASLASMAPVASRAWRRTA